MNVLLEVYAIKPQNHSGKPKNALYCQFWKIVLYFICPFGGFLRKDRFMNIMQKFVDYIRSAKHELTKVTWPSKDLTTRYSILVIIISVAVALFFGVLDVGLSKLVTVAVVQRAGNASDITDTPVVPTTVPLDNAGGSNGDGTPNFDFSGIDATGGDASVQVVPLDETATDNANQ